MLVIDNFLSIVSKIAPRVVELWQRSSSTSPDSTIPVPTLSSMQTGDATAIQFVTRQLPTDTVILTKHNGLHSRLHCKTTKGDVTIGHQ